MGFLRSGGHHCQGPHHRDAGLPARDYGFVNRVTTSDGTGIPGGVGGGPGYHSHVLFYIGVPDVEAPLQRAETLLGKRRMGPERAPTGLVVGRFTDPEGNPIGVAGPAWPA
jgi:predicted enzyme related to lactoylglutathione lyase